VYSLGFKEAGDALVEECLSRHGIKDALFYPICFCYRHFIELDLKYLIAETESLYYVLEKCGPTRGELCESVVSKLADTHSLERLFNWLVVRLALVTDEPFPREVGDAIIDLHNFDPTSQVFRYPVSRGGKVHIPEQQR